MSGMSRFDHDDLSLFYLLLNFGLLIVSVGFLHLYLGLRLAYNFPLL